MTWRAEKVLKAIKDNHAVTPELCIREADLVALTDMSAHHVEQTCLKLRKHGLLVKTDIGCHTITAEGVEAINSGKTFRSGPKASLNAPRNMNQKSRRARAWLAMRIRNKFTLADIMMLVVEQGDKDPTSNLGKYFRALEKAGFLVALKREKGSQQGSNGFKRYWLLPNRNKGPLAPLWRPHKKTVYDPNTEKEYDMKGKEVAA